MCFQMPRILNVIEKEHRLLTNQIAQKDIIAIISDHRYGLYHPQVPSIFVAHQLNIQLPFPLNKLQRQFYHFHLRQLKYFHQIWIPDSPKEPNLSGDLSHVPSLPKKAKFIGPLSRFEQKIQVPSNSRWADTFLAIILSGPEPQRSILESMLVKQLASLSIQTVIVQGKPESSYVLKNGHLSMYSSLPSEELYHLLTSASVVLSRPGYSSIMDYAALGLPQVILVPTPGQTEQLYLARYFQSFRVALYQPQHKLRLKDALNNIQWYSGFKHWHKNTSYQQLRKKAISELLDQIKT